MSRETNKQGIKKAFFSQSEFLYQHGFFFFFKYQLSISTAYFTGPAQWHTVLNMDSAYGRVDTM